MVEFNFQEKNTFSRYQLSNIQTIFFLNDRIGGKSNHCYYPFHLRLLLKRQRTVRTKVGKTALCHGVKMQVTIGNCYQSYINSKALKRITGVRTTRRSNRLTRSKSKAFLSSKSLNNFIYYRLSISDTLNFTLIFCQSIPHYRDGRGYFPYIGVPIL